VNIRKSKAMVGGAWSTTVNMMNIPYCTEMTILGFQFSSTVGLSGKSSWTRVTRQVKAMASEVYGRDLCLIQRIQYVHTFLLAKIWHIAQIFPSQKSMLDTLQRRYGSFGRERYSVSLCLPYNTEERRVA